MGHGTPDWWGSEPSETIYGVQDVGELAARLGSIDTHDRLGNVVWLSGFEDGIVGFTTATSGTSAAVELSTATARSGAYSCKLTAGSTVSKLAGIVKNIPYPVLSKFGGEVAFTWSISIDFLLLDIWLYDGTNYTVFEIKFDETLGKIYYYNAAGGYTEIVALPAWATNTKLFHIAKLVVDLDARKYVRLIVDGNLYSLAGISAYTTASAVEPYLIFAIYNVGPGATNPALYVDNMIITQNEP